MLDAIIIQQEQKRKENERTALLNSILAVAPATFVKVDVYGGIELHAGVVNAETCTVGVIETKVINLGMVKRIEEKTLKSYKHRYVVNKHGQRLREGAGEVIGTVGVLEITFFDGATMDARISEEAK